MEKANTVVAVFADCRLAKKVAMPGSLLKVEKDDIWINFKASIRNKPVQPRGVGK